MKPEAALQRAVVVLVRLATVETIEVRDVTAEAVVTRYPYPKADAWEVVPERGNFW